MKEAEESLYAVEVISLTSQGEGHSVMRGESEDELGEGELGKETRYKDPKHGP